MEECISCKKEYIPGTFDTTNIVNGNKYCGECLKYKVECTNCKKNYVCCNYEKIMDSYELESGLNKYGKKTYFSKEGDSMNLFTCILCDQINCEDCIHDFHSTLEHEYCEDCYCKYYMKIIESYKTYVVKHDDYFTYSNLKLTDNDFKDYLFFMFSSSIKKEKKQLNEAKTSFIGYIFGAPDSVLYDIRKYL